MKTDQPEHPRRIPATIWIGMVVGGALPLLLAWFSLAPTLSSTATDTLAVQETARFEQWLTVLTAFGVKPTYMLLSLGWIIWLWKRQAAELVALRWGLIWFLAGETACAINYVFFGGYSAFADYLHSYGMAVGFSFIAFAVLEGTDRRFIKYSGPKDRCAALSLCRACIKHAEVPCGLRRLFSVAVPALALIALMPLCSEIRTGGYRTRILDSAQDYLQPAWSQWFEARYCAWVAVLLLTASWLVLLFKKPEPVPTAKVLLAAALGPLGFGLMRLFLRTAYSHDLVWSNLWEEWTELIFVAGTGFVLWVFRQGLLRQEAAPLPTEPVTPPLSERV
jgi:hypothetical protein